MSSNIDFKALWNKAEPGGVPDVNEIFAKANQLNRKTRNKIWRRNIILLLTAVFMGLVWWHYQPEMLTTKIGLILIIGAIVIFSIANGQIVPLLTECNMETDSQQYLARMIHIKQKQEFLNKTMLTGYFILFSIGIALYMIEYAGRGSLTFKALAYGITFAWIAYSWIYIRPRTIRKQQAEINAIISKLEEVNGQLSKED